MSVDNTGDTDSRTSTLNGALNWADRDSPTKSSTQLNQSRTNSESGPSWNCPSPIASPKPGTPRIIRRVDSITAVYAPDKDARTASRDRIRVSSPEPLPTEHVIYVQRPPPEPEQNSKPETDTKRHSIEFHTPSVFNDSGEEGVEDDFLSNDDSAVDVSPPPHSNHRVFNSSSSPPKISPLIPDTSANRSTTDTLESPPQTPVAVELQMTDGSFGEWESPEREIPATVVESLRKTDHDSPCTATTTIAHPHAVPDMRAPKDSPSTEVGQENHLELADCMGDASDSSKIRSATGTNHQLKLGDSPGSAFHSVVPHATTPPPMEQQSSAVLSVPLAEGMLCEVSDSQLPEDIVRISSEETCGLDTPVESVTAVSPSSLSATTAPLLNAAERTEIEENKDVISYQQTQPTDSVQAKQTTVLASQSVLPEPTISEIAPQIVEHVHHSKPQFDTDVASSTPNLALIADHIDTPDVELQAMTLSPSALTARSDPATNLRLSCYSPAELVKVTGGASLEIVRNIEGADEVGLAGDQAVGETVNPTVESEPPLATPTTFSRPARTGGTMFDRRRMSAPDTDLGLGPSAVPVINIQVKVDAHLEPSTPEEVDASSKMIFGNFIAERYKLEVNASASLSAGGSKSSASASTSINSTAASTSAVNVSVTAVHRPAQDDIFGTDFASIPRPNPNSMEAAVARNLAQIGDEISRQYGRQLDRMIKLLPGDECPVDVFTNVARALFNRGPTNWGQIVTLFYFGYRLVVRRVRSGVVNAFSQVCQCLISFCRQLNIFAWIAQRGGWLILKYLRLGGTSETIQDEEISAEQYRSTGTSSGTTHERTTGEDHDEPLSINPWLGTFLVVSSGIAIACVAIIMYRRLNSS